MSETVKINSVTANTPVDVYYCDSMSASCVFVASVSTFPFEFDVPNPYDETDFLIKIIDSEGCIEGRYIYVTPTPTQTPTITQTMTQTPSYSPTQTISPTVTNSPTVSPTPSVTKTQTPTVTPTVTITKTPIQTPTITPTVPVIISHNVGQIYSLNSGTTCASLMTILKYYTYASEASTIPVVNATVYTFVFGGVLYSPLVGNGLFYKMTFGSSNYAVKVDNFGKIINFALCI